MYIAGYILILLSTAARYGRRGVSESFFPKSDASIVERLMDGVIPASTENLSLATTAVSNPRV